MRTLSLIALSTVLASCSSGGSGGSIDSAEFSTDLRASHGWLPGHWLGVLRDENDVAHEAAMLIAQPSAADPSLCDAVIDVLDAPQSFVSRPGVFAGAGFSASVRGAVRANGDRIWFTSQGVAASWIVESQAGLQSDPAAAAIGDPRFVRFYFPTRGGNVTLTTIEQYSSPDYIVQIVTRHENP